MGLGETHLLSQDLETSLIQRLGQGLGVPNNLRRVLSAKGHHLGKHHSLPRQVVEVVVAYVSWKGSPFDRVSVLRLGKDQASLRSGKRLVRARGHSISALVHGVLELSTCHQTRNMRSVKADICTMVMKDRRKLTNGVWEW